MALLQLRKISRGGKNHKRKTRRNRRKKSRKKKRKNKNTKKDKLELKNFLYYFPNNIKKLKASF